MTVTFSSRARQKSEPKSRLAPDVGLNLAGGQRGRVEIPRPKTRTWEKLQLRNIEYRLFKRVCPLIKRKKKKEIIIKLMLTCHGRGGSLMLKPLAACWEAARYGQDFEICFYELC